MASPALHASRPAGSFDLRRLGEYNIVLGDSLKHGAGSGEQFLSVRYNWQPRGGLRAKEGVLKATDSGYRFSAETNDDTYLYRGHSRPTADDTRSLALVFDKGKTAFVLEDITKSVDLNVVEGPSMSKGEAREQRQLPVSSSKEAKPVANGDGKSHGHDDGAESSNPFDFRHFMDEAKENIEKASAHPGNATPLAGSRTPMSGLASPMPGPSRLGGSTPSFKPTSTPNPAQKKRKTESSKLTSPVRQKHDHGGRKPEVKAKGTLSKERISDSDHEMGDTIIVANSAPLQKGHSQDISGGFGRSPHIVVHDSDLEIDMGSPPPEERGRKRGRIDLGAFRSHTGTPVMGMTSNRKQAKKEEVGQPELESSHEEDGDVEAFELESPRANRLSTLGSRSVSVIEPHPASSQPEQAPTPTNIPVDDDDDLAAQLEAALEEDDIGAVRAHQAGYGLGISGAPQAAVDDESEVSEEE